MEKISKEELMKKLNLTKEEQEKVTGGSETNLYEKCFEKCYTKRNRSPDRCYEDCLTGQNS